MYAIKYHNNLEGIFLMNKNRLFFTSITKQNIGLGSKMMRFLQSKYEKIITETYLSNPAINFYINNGFRIKKSIMVFHRIQK